MRNSVKERIMSAVAVAIGVSIGKIIFGDTASLWDFIRYVLLYYGLDYLISVLRRRKG